MVTDALALRRRCALRLIGARAPTQSDHDNQPRDTTHGESLYSNERSQFNPLCDRDE